MLPSTLVRAHDAGVRSRSLHGDAMEHREDKAKVANALTKFRHRESPFVLGANLAAAGRPVLVNDAKTCRGEDLTEKAWDARPPQRVGSFRRSRWAPRIPALRAAFAPAGTPAL
jgi:hypothetical protein